MSRMPWSPMQVQPMPVLGPGNYANANARKMFEQLDRAPGAAGRQPSSILPQADELERYRQQAEEAKKSRVPWGPQAQPQMPWQPQAMPQGPVQPRPNSPAQTMEFVPGRDGGGIIPIPNAPSNPTYDPNNSTNAAMPATIQPPAHPWLGQAPMTTPQPQSPQGMASAAAPWAVVPMQPAQPQQPATITPPSPVMAQPQAANPGLSQAEYERARTGLWQSGMAANSPGLARVAPGAPTLPGMEPEDVKAQQAGYSGPSQAMASTGSPGMRAPWQPNLGGALPGDAALAQQAQAWQAAEAARQQEVNTVAQARSIAEGPAFGTFGGMNPRNTFQGTPEEYMAQAMASRDAARAGNVGGAAQAWPGAWDGRQLQSPTQPSMTGQLGQASIDDLKQMASGPVAPGATGNAGAAGVPWAAPARSTRDALDDKQRATMRDNKAKRDLAKAVRQRQVQAKAKGERITPEQAQAGVYATREMPVSDALAEAAYGPQIPWVRSQERIAGLPYGQGAQDIARMQAAGNIAGAYANPNSGAMPVPVSNMIRDILGTGNAQASGGLMNIPVDDILQQNPNIKPEEVERQLIEQGYSAEQAKHTANQVAQRQVPSQFQQRRRELMDQGYDAVRPYIPSLSVPFEAIAGAGVPRVAGLPQDKLRQLQERAARGDVNAQRILQGL